MLKSYIWYVFLCIGWIDNSSTEEKQAPEVCKYWSRNRRAQRYDCNEPQHIAVVGAAGQALGTGAGGTRAARAQL